MAKPEKRAPMLDPRWPMIRQIPQIREQYPGVVLLFRFGDNVEAFDEDAATLALIAPATMGEMMWDDEKHTTATLPFAAAEPFVSHLVAAGRRVAICEEGA